MGAGGRICATEIMVATDAVRALVREGKTHQLRNAIVTGRNAGMQTLESHLSDLAVRGFISPEAARATANRPDELQSLQGAAV
jgi:twitching motility protein PilT